MREGGRQGHVTREKGRDGMRDERKEVEQMKKRRRKEGREEIENKRNR